MCKFGIANLLLSLTRFVFRHGFAFCMLQALVATFDTSVVGLGALASKHGLSITQMRRHIKATAFITGRLYYRLAETLVQFCREIEVGLITDLLQFDETRQRLLMSLGRNVLQTQMSNAASVTARRNLCRLL